MRAVALILAVAVTTPRPLPVSDLRVKDGSEWRTWWRSTEAPTFWRRTPSPLARTIRWKAGAPGIEWAEIQMAGRGEAWRTLVVAARIDPRRVKLALDTAFAGVPSRPNWTAAQTDDEALFAVNAGQFTHSLPWGLLVLDGRELLPAGRGPLASALAQTSSGEMVWAHGNGARQIDANGLSWGFQSYPTLLRDGEVPGELRADAGVLDVSHRDARAAIGTSAEGRLIVALTRFDGLGGGLGFVPFGLTVPEMAAVMGALGARDAMMLDGGISAQMMIRDASGRPRKWEGMRRVPMGLVGLPRN
jgi:exopolysaccharide biosynthesis protein